MSKHLICYGSRITDIRTPFIEVGNLEYIKRRLQLWKWRKKRTMGRPVLCLWKQPKTPEGSNHG